MLLERAPQPPAPAVPGRESSPPAKMDDEIDLAAMAFLLRGDSTEDQDDIR